MATEIKMPKLGMTMTKGKIVQWLKSEGDKVVKEEPVFAVENDKVNIDVESPTDGILLKIEAEEGEIIPVGETVAYIGNEEEKLSERNVGFGEDTNSEGLEIEAIKATPAARALAKGRGVDLKAVKQYCGKERIKRKDVEEYSQGSYENVMTVSCREEQPYVDIMPSNIRLVGAEKMIQSFTEIPHFYLTVQVETTEIEKMVKNAKINMKETGKKPTFTDVIVWIVARVIKEYPIVNSIWNDGTIRQFRDVNVGIATDTTEGLVVPVIKQAESKSFKEIVKNRSEIVSAAREGKLTVDDINGGTFTISNLGMFGIDCFQAVINPPECALLAVGAVQYKVIMNNGELRNVPVINMSLSCDHRVLDGAIGAKFLGRLKKVMESPEKLLDDDLF